MGCQEGVHALDRSINDKDTDLCADLDWKRVSLWYAEPVQYSVDCRRVRCVRNPREEPWRQSGTALTGQNNTATLILILVKLQPCDPEDPLYALIRLHANPPLSLSHMLNSTSFGFGELHIDWSLCCHMYIMCTILPIAKNRGRVQNQSCLTGSHGRQRPYGGPQSQRRSAC